MTAARPRILLTNDDSHDSPLFHLAIDALRTLGDLHVAVPATEQSWKGKSMTRYGPLYAERIAIHDFPAWSITGTPADCVNLALYNLLDAPPDIVVSGINIGKNVGLGFVFASGTIGACLEANIAGIPGLALSQELVRDDFLYWNEHRAFRPETTATLTRAVGELVPRVWHHFIEGHLDQQTTWNVNFPYTPAALPDIRRTRIGHSFYRDCFHQKGDQYHFGLATAELDESPDTDDATLKAGHVSATLLDLRAFGQRL
ncbi:MAG: 5'/3'-nucleotidase SurE [Gammaproteobacteria bacterium]|nr:5'/3'-nucleotidase SurE [Gammaproteobacteria bacterium]